MVRNLVPHFLVWLPVSPLTVTAFIRIVERTRRKMLAKLLEELVADTIKQADPQLQAKGLRPLEPLPFATLSEVGDENTPG